MHFEVFGCSVQNSILARHPIHLEDKRIVERVRDFKVRDQIEILFFDFFDCFLDDIGVLSSDGTFTRCKCVEVMAISQESHHCTLIVLDKRFRDNNIVQQKHRCKKTISTLFFTRFLIIEPPCCCCLLLPYLPFSRIFLTQKRICCYHFEDFMGKISERADLGEFLLLPCPACFSRTLCARECVLVPAFGNTFFESKLLRLLLRESASFPEKVIHFSFGRFSVLHKQHRTT